MNTYHSTPLHSTPLSFPWTSKLLEEECHDARILRLQHSVVILDDGMSKGIALKSSVQLATTIRDPLLESRLRRWSMSSPSCACFRNRCGTSCLESSFSRSCIRGGGHRRSNTFIPQHSSRSTLTCPFGTFRLFRRDFAAPGQVSES